MVIIDIEKTGEKIKILMEEKGLNEKTLARLVGITPATVSYWIRGKRLPLIEIMVALSAVFEVPMEDILSFDRMTGS